MTKENGRNTGMSRRTALKLAASAGVAAPFIARAHAEERTINIGVIQPLSGANAQFGINSRNGIQLVADEVNAAGGIKSLGRSQDQSGDRRFDLDADDRSQRGAAPSHSE